ncbi:MAG TPA: epoxyqueuosine reductase QueH [bacterium]|nr:epoxyqueuosine reductase QueH [bacterium]HPQ66103.1 epoxyqueuosine reductase QueH [bacterium]
MKVLLHVCCGPCATWPFQALEEEGLEADGFFYNPNIHPYREYRARREGAESLAGQSGRRLLTDAGYDMPEFFRLVAGRETDRCRLCYRLRLERTARAAAERGYGAFTSTLLLSVHQRHGLVREEGEAAGAAAGIDFLYRDFRTGWKEHWALTDRYRLYKQQYCGCLYSEYERFARAAGRS